jgi:hypothetical protein
MQPQMHHHQVPAEPEDQQLEKMAQLEGGRDMWQIAAKAVCTVRPNQPTQQAGPEGCLQSLAAPREHDKHHQAMCSRLLSCSVSSSMAHYDEQGVQVVALSCNSAKPCNVRLPRLQPSSQSGNKQLYKFK